MTNSSDQPQRPPARVEGRWAQPIHRLQVKDVPTGAINLNVDGRQVVSPLQGFGQLWQKTYRLVLPDVKLAPVEIMTLWKEHFPKFQPPDNHFYPPLTGIEPGQVLWIDSTLPIIPGLPGVIPIASGVMVLYVDDTCFTIMTPEGFPEAGWNTFSVTDEEGMVVAQVQSMARATDPVYEFGLRLMGGARKQEETWFYVLSALASHLGIQGQVEMQKLLLDPALQWAQAKNVWHNASIRTTLHALAAPIRWMKKLGNS
jgi:hypothetical protein